MNIMHAGKIHLYLEILEVKLTGRGTETVHSEKTPQKTTPVGISWIIFTMNILTESTSLYRLTSRTHA